jgi:hypothetical protein
MQSSPASHHFFLLSPNTILTPCSQTPSIYVLPSVRETKFHTHTRQQVKLRLFMFCVYTLCNNGSINWRFGGIEESVSKSFRTESITKYTLTTINTRWEATQRVMAVKLTKLAHTMAKQLHLVADSCTICNSRSRRPVRKLLDTPSCTEFHAKLIRNGTH